MPVKPGYIRVRREARLTLPAPILPLLCAVKVLAALVLFAVSADNVVLGVMVKVLPKADCTTRTAKNAVLQRNPFIIATPENGLCTARCRRRDSRQGTK